MIISALGKKKKADKEKRSAPGEAGNEPKGSRSDATTEIFERLFGMDEEKNTHPFEDEKPYEAVASTTESEHVSANYYEERFAEEKFRTNTNNINQPIKTNAGGHLEYSKKTRKNPIENKRVATNQLKRKKQPAFNLRKAVIYSELLNRKY